MCLSVFPDLRHIFALCFRFWGLFLCCSCIAATLGRHCNTWGSTLPPLLDYFTYSRGRIYVAFGEHPAAGVRVCVCSSKLDSSGLVVRRVSICVNVYVGVCSLVRLFADSRLSLFPWLVVWVYGLCVLVCFSAPAAHFRGLLAHLETLLCFSCTLGGPWNSIVTLGAPLCHPCWTILQFFCNW